MQPSLPFDTPAQDLQTAPKVHFVRVTRARRYVMRVRPDGDLRVTIPRGGSMREAVKFAERHLEWAHRQRSKVPRSWAACSRPTVRRVSIRNQRSRWGSCSARGHIALNYRLLLMPPDVREYILIHELMHLKQANHSIRFWRLVEAACPGFRDAERWLRKHGAALM